MKSVIIDQFNVYFVTLKNTNAMQVKLCGDSFIINTLVSKLPIVTLNWVNFIHYIT